MTIHTTFYRWCALVATTIMVAACGENPVQVLPTDSLEASRIKFFNFGPGAPSVNFYADNVKMTAILSATGSEATSGVAYGSVGNGGAYSHIAPGTYSITGRISATTDKDLPIDTVHVTIADGKLYSFYLSGIYNTIAKTVDAFAVEDPVTPPTDYTVAYVRFVNAISNASPLILYAQYTTGDTTRVDTLTTTVAYKFASPFVTLPAGVYNLFARYADSTTNKMSRATVTFLGGRLYTVGARGDITVAPPPATNPTGTRGPWLDNTANR